MPIGKTKDSNARKVLNNGWLWRGRESGWVSVRTLGDLAPGMTILLATCVLRLLEHYGLFRLAYFEALFRAADMRASMLAKTAPGGEAHAG